jgi:uncharacterized protein
MKKTYRVKSVGLRTHQAGLKKYLEKEILPRYFKLDAGHNENHIYNVLKFAYQLNELLGEVVGSDLLTTAVLYHDLGITSADETGRADHHRRSGRLVRQDERLRAWLSEDEIEAVATACEQHRASFKGQRESLLSKIVADADTMDAFNFERTVVYTNREWLPGGSVEEKIKHMYGHYRRKFSSQGYAKFELEEAKELTREFREQMNRVGASWESYREFMLKEFGAWL